MIPWETIDPPSPTEGDDGALSLHRRGDEWSIRTRGVELMNSRRVGSARALATRAAEALANGAATGVAVGGLGMGHTLAAALAAFPRARIRVAEISPRVVGWNRGVLAPLAGRPLDDPRSELHLGDVAGLLRAHASGDPGTRFDAILLDVDNGPEALSRGQNQGLYSAEGIGEALAALAPDGVLAYWSAASVETFERRLRRAGCRVERHRAARLDGARSGPSDTLWIARRRTGGH